MRRADEAYDGAVCSRSMKKADDSLNEYTPDV